MSLEAVIFDKDDTLLDIETGIYLPSHQEAITKHGGNGVQYTSEMHFEQKGPVTEVRFKILIDTFGLQVDTKTLVATYRSIYRSAIETNGVQPMAGAQDLLKALEEEMLKKNKVSRLGVVTNATSANADLTLAKSGLEQYFATVVTADDITKGHGKPHPDGFLITAARLGVDPEKCVVIGDSMVDIAGAKRAGMMAILLQNPAFPLNLGSFIEKPDRIVSSLNEIDPKGLLH